MCLMARDHTSWLIPASSIVLGPMSSTTFPNRLLTKCLLVMTQTHVHRVGDAIQPSHPLFSPFPPALNLCQHQGLHQ